jgi:hypothetical protein
LRAQIATLAESGRSFSHLERLRRIYAACKEAHIYEQLAEQAFKDWLAEYLHLRNPAYYPAPQERGDT